MKEDRAVGYIIAMCYPYFRSAVVLNRPPKYHAMSEDLPAESCMGRIRFRVYRPVVPLLTGTVGKDVVRLPRLGFPAQAGGRHPTPCSLPR